MDAGVWVEPEDAVLKDGTTVRIRVALPEDLSRIEDYLVGLSRESRRLRFGSETIDVARVAAAAARTDLPDHLTLLALRGGGDGSVVGGAQLFRVASERAEMSVSVADALQGHGLGTLLIERLAAAARAIGISTLVAIVYPENHRMIDLLRDGGFRPRIRALPGTIEVEFPTSVDDDAREVLEARADAASRAAVEVFMEPVSLAVVGASRDPTSIGGRLFRNLLLTGFHGVVHPVNPSAEHVQGVRAISSILDIPGAVDVAFIAVPAERVVGVARQCGEKGVRGLVVISAGFSESGREGVDRQRELVAICRDTGMRLIGPNCMGYLNTDAEVLLNGTFASAWPLPGRVGFLSQSGALGLAVMDATTRLGLGLSSFVSVGNKADISSNDLICRWEQDPRTSVILLYLESFGNPRRFARLARRVTRSKPIVAVKSGRSGAGARASSSHTGALLAASDSAVDALFRQTGVIRTDTLEEMLDVATVLANQPLPRGQRLGIVTNAGGLGILCADAAESRGLVVPPLAEGTATALRSFLPSEAAVGNPVDMIASARGEDFARVIDRLARSGEVDALIVIYIPPLEHEAPEVARHVLAAIEGLDGRVPVLTSFLATKGVPDELRSSTMQVPSFAYPEQAAIALAHVARLGTWRERPAGVVRRPDWIRAGEAAATIAEGLSEGSGWLFPDRVNRLLSCYGIATPRSARAGTPEEAGEEAERLATRVALKAIGPLHKTEVGAVRLGLEGRDEVAAAAQEMVDRLRALREPFEGFLVQELVAGGIEMIAGIGQDATFGSVIVCGAGGTLAELIRDVAVGVPPLTDADVHDMVASLATFPLLEGYRGAPRANIEAFEDVIHRIAALAEAHPEVVEMDCNPVAVSPSAAIVLDARVRVAETTHVTSPTHR
jgi:acetyl coenzyme A synthetase (ADP forming)-like protein